MDTLEELDSKAMPQLELRDGELYYGNQPIYKLSKDDDDDMYKVRDDYDRYTPLRKDRNIPMPSWASEENGCIPHKAIKVGNGIVIEYKPIKTLGIGYAKIYIVGKDNQPFPRMKELWGEIHRIWSNEQNHNHQIAFGGTITPTGEIRDQYGSNAPSFDALHKFLVNMNILYTDWKYFPNAKSYKKVEELTKALSAVRDMSRNAEYIENNIQDLREQIRSRQGEIAEMEKNLNDLYENAADAMNLLEENGVNVDDKGKVEGVEDDGSEYISIDGLPGEYYIDSSSLTPCISIGTGHSPISIYKPNCDDYWTKGYDCATSGC